MSYIFSTTCQTPKGSRCLFNARLDLGQFRTNPSSCVCLGTQQVSKIPKSLQKHAHAIYSNFFSISEKLKISLENFGKF